MESGHIQQLNENGFTVIDDVFDKTEIESILKIIDKLGHNKETFRKSKDLFAIRQFLKEAPETVDLIFNRNLKSLIYRLFGENYFIVKSIYFDKPENSNWFVPYHQDLTISVDQKVNIEGFGPYTIKQNQFAVQAPINILEQNFTIRIHLDDTDQNNGALKVIPSSHDKGIYRPENINWSIEKEISCNVKKGGLMIMKPLLLHSSSRTTNYKKRRIIHLEFSNQILQAGLNWSEYSNYN